MAVDCFEGVWDQVSSYWVEPLYRKRLVVLEEGDDTNFVVVVGYTVVGYIAVDCYVVVEHIAVVVEHIVGYIVVACYSVVAEHTEVAERIVD